MTRYVADARGVWLSERSLEVRVRLLRELTEPIQTIYFARRWRVVGSVPGEVARLRGTLDAVENGEPLTAVSEEVVAQPRSASPDHPAQPDVG